MAGMKNTQRPLFSLTMFALVCLLIALYVLATERNIRDSLDDVWLLFGPVACGLIGMVVFGTVGLAVKKLIQRKSPVKPGHGEMPGDDTKNNS
jgi:hypothetical protein